VVNLNQVFAKDLHIQNEIYTLFFTSNTKCQNLGNFSPARPDLNARILNLRMKDVFSKASINSILDLLSARRLFATKL